MHTIAKFSAATWFFLACIYQLSTAKAIDHRYLAVDASQRFDLQNIEVTNHQAVYRGKAFGLDESWESSFRLLYPGSTVTDPVSGTYRMYYEVANSQ